VLVDTDDQHVVEPGRVVDQDALALGQNGVVGGVPRDPETFGNPSDGQMPDHDPLQRPPQPAARQFRARLCRAAGVLAPHVPASGTSVAAYDHLQNRRTPSERLVRQPPNHRVPRCPRATTPAAPPIRLDDPAGQNRAIGFKTLPNGLEADLIEPAERAQVRASEGSVIHVEVFRMGSVRTSILGRPRRLSRDRRARPRYTLSCEEPATTTGWLTRHISVFVARERGAVLSPAAAQVALSRAFWRAA
jgi:hypothetical protein